MQAARTGNTGTGSQPFGPGGGFGLVLGPECVASAGLGHRAGPESEHRSGFDAGFGVAVEAVSFSQL